MNLNEILHLITHAHFSNHPFRYFVNSGGRISHLNILALQCQRVMMMMMMMMMMKDVLYTTVSMFVMAYIPVAILSVALNGSNFTVLVAGGTSAVE